MATKAKPLTREQVETLRAGGNYTKIAMELGIDTRRAARIKQAPSLEEALRIAGALETTMESPQEEPAAVPSKGDQPSARGKRTRGKPPAAKTPPIIKAEDTKALTEASIVAIVPRRLEVNSVLLLVAKKVTEREWGWPEMEVGIWLDNFLYHTMRQHGIIIGSYIRVGKEHGV